MRIDDFTLVEPRVVVGSDLAVLSFGFRSQGGNDTYCWNCAEVYRNDPEGWRLVQTHWSWVQPNPPR